MNERKISILEALNESLEEIITSRNDILIIGQGIFDAERNPTRSGLENKFRDKFITTPIIEDMLGGIGLGLSIGGFKPIVELNYGTFITLALDDIYRLGHWRYRMGEKGGPNILLRISYGGESRGCEFSASLLALVYHLPNIWIATPSTPFFIKGLLKTAIETKRPIIFFEHKNLYSTLGNVPDNDYTVPFGVSSIFKEGCDITIISWSYMSYVALDVASQLSKEGIDIEVISLQTLNPLDMETIFKSIQKTHRVIILEEDPLRGGIGADIGARITETIPGSIIKRLSPKNVPLPPGEKWEKLILPSAEDVVEMCKELCEN